MHIQISCRREIFYGGSSTRKAVLIFCSREENGEKKKRRKFFRGKGGKTFNAERSLPESSFLFFHREGEEASERFFFVL